MANLPPDVSGFMKDVYTVNFLLFPVLYSESQKSFFLGENIEYTEKQSEDIYKPILDGYLQGFISEKGVELFAIDIESWENVTVLPGDNSRINESKYAFRDLNGDSMPELIIYAEMMAETDYSIYTYKNGTYYRIIHGWSRSRLSILKDNSIYNEGSSGAASNSYARYVVDDYGTYVKLDKEYLFDATDYLYENEDHGNPLVDDQFWSVLNGDEYNGEEMNYTHTTYEEAQSFINNCTNQIVSDEEMGWKSFGDYN